MSTSTASNRVVIIDEAKFNKDKDPNWKTHKSYIDFTNDLDVNYNHSLNNRQRLDSSYITALRLAKNSYPLFQIYLKIISQIGETVDHLQFEFKVNNNKYKHYQHRTRVQCVVDIYYASGFVQTIVTMMKKPKPSITSNQTLLNAVQQEHAFKHNYHVPITIHHLPTKRNPLQTKVEYPPHYHRIHHKPSRSLNTSNKMEMDHEDEDDAYQDEHADDDPRNEKSILWRFYGAKRPYEPLKWPTAMDDTFFKDRPDVVRSDNTFTTFTFVNNNPEYNERRGNYHDDWSDVEDADNNDLSINFRSNHPIPTDIFMYYFEVTVAHNHIQSHNAKFKRCYFGLIPQSKIYFPPKDDKIECKVLHDVLIKNKKKYDNNEHNNNEHKDSEKQRRRRRHINHYLNKNKMNNDASSSDDDDDTKDKEAPVAVPACNGYKEDKEKKMLKHKCLKSMKEYDKLFYNLWCDDKIIYSSDDEMHKHKNEEYVMRDRMDHEADDNALDILQARLASKWEPSQSAKDTFVSQVFDDKQITNHSICVKVHSSILTISNKFIYPDEHYNYVFQDTPFAKEKEMAQEVKQEDEDDDDDDDSVVMDGWERIDDETFVLTKPNKFEKRIYLNSSRQVRRSLHAQVLDDDEDDDEEEDEEMMMRMHMTTLDEDDNEYGVLDDGNILIDGLSSFGLLSYDADAEEGDAVYNNGIDDIKENDIRKRWKTSDEAQVKRQRKCRYNKEVEIVQKFASPIRNNDTIGIGINFHLRTLFVTVNGKLVNDKKYNKAFLFRDIFVSEPLYIFGILKHFGNQLSYNFGEYKFRFDLNKYFSREYSGWIKRNHNYISKFMRNTHRSNDINKELLDSCIVDHCIYEGFGRTTTRLICKIFGEENGNKLISHLMICNDIFNTMKSRRCIKECLEKGAIQDAKCNLNKLQINDFSMKYPVVWFQILRQELIELLRGNEMKKAKHLYETQLLGLETFLLSDINPYRLNFDDENKRILKKEINILGTVLINCVHSSYFDINCILMEYRYLFDLKRRYRLRDIVHNLIYNHMKQRENKRIHCLYKSSFTQCAQYTHKLKIYDSQLNLLLKHLCTVYDCYKSNFANYLENIRFI